MGLASLIAVLRQSPLYSSFRQSVTYLCKIIVKKDGLLNKENVNE
ncbi:hypothetical protein KKH3_36430 [Pectobacterium actinidiae]|nr:hypothetical protein KKH3_36430 [Pectobacterium actinidiae]